MSPTFSKRSKLYSIKGWLKNAREGEETKLNYFQAGGLLYQVRTQVPRWNLLFSLEVWTPPRASALGSSAFLRGSWTQQLGMRADASPGPEPACTALKGIDCHRLQARSGFGMNRSSLRIRLHATFAVLPPFVLKLFSLFLFLSSSSGQDRGKRESRTDILFSAVLPDLFLVITRGVRGKQNETFF